MCLSPSRGTKKTKDELYGSGLYTGLKRGRQRNQPSMFDREVSMQDRVNALIPQIEAVKPPPPPPPPAAIPPPPPPPAAATAPSYAEKADRTNTDEEIRKRTGSATNKRKRGKSSLRIRQSGGTSYPGY